MARGIKLKRFAIKQINHYYIHGFRLRVEVAEVNGGMDPKVFVYRRREPDPVTGNRDFDQFCTVASFVDMSRYPPDNPDSDSAFFRLDYVELDIEASAHYEDTWQLIRQQVCLLVAALNRADMLVVAEEVWCGEPTEPASSESSASSESTSTP